MEKSPLRTLKKVAKEEPFNSDKAREYDPRPRVTLSETDLPEMLKWPIEGKYKLIIEVEMTGIRESDYGPNKGKKEGEFKITKVGIEEKESK